MGDYVVVETRDPFDSADVTALYDLSGALGREGNGVTVFLTQNGVLPARAASSAAPRLAELAGTGRVWADTFALRERGIRDDELVAGVTPVSMESVVDLIVRDGTKVIWH
jgi:hypothetical protein